MFWNRLTFYFIFVTFNEKFYETTKKFAENFFYGYDLLLLSGLITFLKVQSLTYYTGCDRKNNKFIWWKKSSLVVAIPMTKTIF